MKLFDHPVLYEKSGTGHQFYSKALELATNSFRKNGDWLPVLLENIATGDQFFSEELDSRVSSVAQ